MGKKLSALFLGLLLCLSLFGCSTFTAFNAKTLMAPPKANEDQQAIHKLLQGNRQDVTFIYPKNGQYRSAIIMQDFTGDGQRDSIGFRALENGGGVEVQFLEKTDGKWRTVAAFKNTALQVDRVCFGNLTGAGPNSVLIGWGSAVGDSGRTAFVSAYIYDRNGGVSEYSLGLYSEMALTDLDGDGLTEIFTVDKFLPAETEEDSPSPAKARVYAWDGRTMSQTYTADADNSITSYSSAVFGRLTATLNGVVLDGAKADGSMTTQVFYLKDGLLINAPGSVNTEGYLNPFSRPPAAPLVSRDLNGDGYLDIPKATALPVLPEDAAPDSTNYLVKWFVFRTDSDGSLTARTLVNSAESYWFRLPYQLEGRITASNDALRRTATYTEVTESPETGEKLLGSPLFAIRAFTRSSWESRGETGGYEYLQSQGDTVYGMQILTKDDALLRYIEQIRDGFQLLGE